MDTGLVGESTKSGDWVVKASSVSLRAVKGKFRY